MDRGLNVRIHFIDEETDGVVLRKLARHVPQVDDEIRFGGVNNEQFYKVVRVVWVYDEEEFPVDRVNIGVRQS